MKKQYTVFVATDELCTSRMVMQYGGCHDYIWRVNQTEEVLITLPIHVHVAAYRHIHLLYNPDMLDILYATIITTETPRKRATTVRLRILPRELGSTTLGVAYDPPPAVTARRQSYYTAGSARLIPSF